MAERSDILKTIFPSEWSNKLLTVKEIQDHNVKGYVIEARVALGSKEQFNEWLRCHEKMTQTKYRLLRDYPKAGKYVLLKAEYACRHITQDKTKADKTSKKHTCCPAKLLVRLRAIHSRFRSKNQEELYFPCTLVLYYVHNHSTATDIALESEQKVVHWEEKMKQKFIEMFKGGYSASVALDMHKNELLEECADEYDSIIADHKICPDMTWLQELSENFMKDYGEWSKEKLMSTLKQVVEKFDAEQGNAEIQTIGEHTIIALCTPLMKRSHSLKSAGEIVFIDSSGVMEKSKCYVFVLMAYSCVEGLPLGVLITTSDSENVVTAALRLLTEILPEKAFGQYGKRGPEVFLTANNTLEQRSVKSVFPQATLLLCSFHMLHSLWKWLWDKENGIDENERCHLFSLAFKIMNTKTAQEFTDCFNSALQNEVVKKYPQFQKYLYEINATSAKWAVCVQNEIVDKNKPLSAIEIANYVLKDRVFLAKAYSILQLFEHFTKEVETYYREKIIHCINDMIGEFLQSSYKGELKALDSLEVKKLPTGQFQVSNKSNVSRFVDTVIGVCSCSPGLTGALCIHQYAVSQKHFLDSSSMVPDDDTIKKELYWIATNSLNLPWMCNWGTANNDLQSSNLSLMEEDEEDDDDMETIDFEIYDPGTNELSGNTKDDALKKEARQMLQKIVSSVMDRYDSNPTEFYKAVMTASANYQTLSSEHEILSALKTFGKANTTEPVLKTFEETNSPELLP